MTVHHAGTLTEAYFESYLTLIMNARNYDIKQAKTFMEKELLKETSWNLETKQPKIFKQLIKKFSD